MTSDAASGKPGGDPALEQPDAREPISGQTTRLPELLLPDSDDLDQTGDGSSRLPDVLPVLPLAGTVIFPYVIVPLSVAPDRSLRAVDNALSTDRLLMLVLQKDATAENPSLEDLHDVGTVSTIMRMLKLPDGRIRILVQGVARARIETVSQTEPFFKARIEPLDRKKPRVEDLASEAMVRNVRDGLEQALSLGKGISPEIMVVVANLDDPGRLADLAASNLELSIETAQELLETDDGLERLRKISDLLHREIDLLQMQQAISSQAREEMDRGQREYFLRQQLQAIREELGEADDFAAEIAEFRRLAQERALPTEGLEELEKQIRRLERSFPDSAEGTVIRTYLDWLTGLPWSLLSDDDLDLENARRVLDKDHYGLLKVKERVLEFLAVRKLKANTRGPILCFVGPPGVGKTSLGRSIARALGRQFVRLSLGGVRDEAEIRGHRRTYVGAMPGRILQGLHRAQTSNPVFMLDEIDKIGSDYRGDPSSALLEVLDPEQNFDFRDHYLTIPYDLSQVIFITTANLLDPILPAFLDRMEIIRLSGYTGEEKLRIARRHLLPKQLREHGLTRKILRITAAGLKKIIRDYTREAGLRGLEREIGAICRKAAVQAARGENPSLSHGPSDIAELLGPPKHFHEALLDRHRIGVATGMAWTAAGGDLLLIEVVAVPGKGQLLLTGRLGEVMKESGQAALSYVRTFAARHGYDAGFFSKHDIHVHAPAGSVPKDGPSAGVTIATAIISNLVDLAVDRRVALTGEITLRGEILPVGGIKEKILAARAAGIKTILMPKLNEQDLEKVPEAIRTSLTFHFPSHMEDLLPLALVGWKTNA